MLGGGGEGEEGGDVECVILVVELKPLAVGSRCRVRWLRLWVVRVRPDRWFA